MLLQLDIEGISQYNESINSSYRPSACGPTTAYVLLQNICLEKHISRQIARNDVFSYVDFLENLYFPIHQESISSLSINDLYKILGCTRIGLFRWRLIRNLSKLLGPSYIVKKCTLNDALHELHEGRPVAMKFDQYFTFQWRSKPTYKYHWVPLIGYEIKDDKLYLIFHDNGGRNRESIVRKTPYQMNHKVLSFVKIAPNPELPTKT